MALNFNVSPYYDDFDDTKNFHRILFKPGYAVQARELTQSQTILQDQITKFADNIFKQNSPVTGGQVTTNLNCNYIKLQETYNNVNIDVTLFQGKLITNATGTIIARVIKTSAASAGDPPTLIVTYQSGTHFSDGDTIYDVASNLAATAIISNSTGISSVASISKGVFYVLGNFVQVPESTIILSKYSNTPTLRVGLNITETVIDYINDSSLLDPAIGASNYQAPGADRYEIALELSTRPIQFGDDQNFIELLRITDGQIAKIVQGSVYNVIDDYFAKRTYDTNGDYIVEDFKLTPKTNNNSSLYTLSVGKGVAYVRGYRLENQIPVDLTSNRARTTETQLNSPVFTDYGSYFYVDTVRGGNTSFFDVTTTQSIDFHCVSLANVSISSDASYNSTKVASGYIRGLVYNYNTNDTDANTYVFKAFVNDIQNAVLSNTAVSGTASTITLPSSFSSVNDAYVGVNISLTGGTSAGDFRTITAYNGSTKIATVSQNFSAVPDNTTKFSLNFDTSDIDTLVSIDGSRNILGSAKINASSRVGGSATGDTVLQNPSVPEMVWSLGNPFVSTLIDTSYTTQQVWRNVSFTSSGGGVTAQINYEGDYLGVIKNFGTSGTTLSSDIVKQNYTVIVTNKGTNTLINNGDIVTWTGVNRTVTLDNDSSIATFASTDLSPFTATIISKVYVSNGDNTGHILKFKNLIKANTATVYTSGTTVNTYTFVDDTLSTSTGQIYIQNGGLVSPGNKQSLYLADVKRVVKIIDTKSPATVPNVGMLTNSTYDVTNNYTLDDGQRDNYYDHASITLKPGAPQPSGNILVFVDYYQHTGGDGFFSIKSYLNSASPEAYQEIPTFTSRHGTLYALRDCVDFRPARLNAQSSFIYRYANSGASNHGVFLPVDSTTFTGDYTYYLGRKDKLVLSKDRSFQVVEGAPSVNPIFPAEPDGSLVVAEITHNPYTGYIPTEVPTGRVSDLSIVKVKHKRFTMQDIAGLENRVNDIEYYTSLSLLEQNTQALQIADAYGLNRFKNGILVDNFSGFSVADTSKDDYSASINRREKVMTALQNVKNFPLKSSALVYSLGKLSSSPGYAVDSDGFNHIFSLPYTTANVISQKIASRTYNLNPFNFVSREGVTTLTPNIDNWVDTNYAPSLLIIDPALQIYQANSAAVTLLSAGDWKAISGTSTASVQNWSTGGRNWSATYATTTTTTVTNYQQNNIMGNMSKLDNTYSINNGYITDISILPWIRRQQVAVQSKGLLFNTSLNAYFDKTNVNNYFRKANIIELTSVTGSFSEGDIIGYYTGGVFTPTGKVLGVYNYPGTTNTRLYVAADGNTTSYTTTGTIRNAFFDTNGVYQSYTASGSFASTKHYGGAIRYANGTSITLANTASSTDNYYSGNTIYVTDGTGAGYSASISAYNGSTKIATVTPSLTSANGDIYSIGTISSDEIGSTYGILCIPSNTFHNGQRIFRLDNSTGGDTETATTYAEAIYYAEGLQAKAQKLDFGVSPAGAKNTFTQTNYKSQTTISSSTVLTSYNRWDPLAQTFIVEKTNYPNGLFLKSIKLFFRTKATSTNDPVTLSIVGTLNGYPNGDTLDHSIVTVYPSEIKTSESPHYLDSTSYTEFTFSAPVYIQPGVMYSMILKSNSNEYNIWTASLGDTALTSSIKNLPSDPLPSTITKISSSPYIGTLFLSQNAITWTADQNSSLMFTMERCVFDTTQTPTINFVIPKKLPQKTLVDSSVDYYLNANSINSVTESTSNTNILVDAFNVTTTDFVPTKTGINYSYAATLQNGSSAGNFNITPGKFGTSMQDDIYLSDGKGERVLVANSNSSFTVYATLNSNDNTVSPVISDAGLSAYAIKWNINNCELSNNLITIINGGSGYSATPTVTISSPTGSGASQAYASANVVGGVIQSIYFTNTGSGYITTPTITITDGTGTNASANVQGETSTKGGPAKAKYITKKVVLEPGFDSGDLNVYLTAYRPVNTDINVYYKILNRNDTQNFDDGNWQLMTKINSTGTLYSSTRNDLYEYTFAPGTSGIDQGYISYTNKNGQTYNTFGQFAIKVVLTSTDATYTPFLTDMRAIALPATVNTTV